MSDTTTPGLRGLPLSQYLLRGRRVNAAAQYEELRRLQEENETVTPITGGPFRLFMKDEAKLRSVNKDPRSLLASLNEGLEVLHVKLTPEGTAGEVVGLVDRGRLRIVIGHEPEPPALADWQLRGVESGRPQGQPLAWLTAVWSIPGARRGEAIAGNAADAVAQFEAVKRRHNTWLGSWCPPVVSAPFLIFHLAGGLPKNDAMDRLFNALRRGTSLFDSRRRKQTESSGMGSRQLVLHAPEYHAMLIADPAPFADAGVNEWLVKNVQTAPDDLISIVQLDVQCHVFTRRVREQFRRFSGAQAWLAELDRCRQNYERWRLHDWPIIQIDGGFFNLRNSQPGQTDLQQQKVTPEQLCDAMNHGLLLYELPEQESEVIVAVPDGLECRILLTPYKPEIGKSDWKLISLREVDVHLSPFARIDAKWEKGSRGGTPGAGDAAGLIRELEVLQDRHREVDKQISIELERFAGEPPELSERVTSWRRVCELERDLLEVGVTRLEREGKDFALVPEEQDVVEQWIEDARQESPEGVSWDRKKLKLEVGSEFAILTLSGPPAVQGQSEEILLRGRCDDPRGRALLDRLCETKSVSEEDPKVSLYLPDSQLGKITKALDWLDPNSHSRPQRPSEAVGDYLTPDELSLQTLRRVLARPGDLGPITRPWPPLPVPPLAGLSPKQEEAVRAAVFGPDMTLIQGPPGTGKTTVILEILRQLFRSHGRNAGFKVLLVAPTHGAVDNVLERLVAPRKGSNLVMELGVAPYRVGSTRRIAEHLRGFTLDCFNTKYLEALERDVAQAVGAANQDCERDQQVLNVLEAGATREAASWASALQSGELLEAQPGAWPASLGEPWQTEVETQEGRVRAWRHWKARGSRPEERAKLLQRWLDFLRHNPRFFSELLVANANLVCATTIGCATHELRSVVYDYVIVDEAGKEEARRLLVPLIRGERWVLVGDHQQLPPYADDTLQAQMIREGLDPRTITRSLFEELQEPFEHRGCYVFLDRQGRMHPDISAFVSERFYGSRLHDFPHAATHEMPGPAFLPDAPKLLVLDTQQLANRHETRRGNGFVNLLEQDLTLHLLRAFARLPAFRGGRADGSLADLPTIGVIAPYRLQVEDIERKLRRDSLLRILLRDGVLQVGTVDSFQGQERDLILFTCTRSNSRGRLGFVDNRQRLNVALSRARCRLIVLADGRAVEQARLCADVSGDEAETRDHLHALFAFAGKRKGILMVPGDWRTCWRG